MSAVMKPDHDPHQLAIDERLDRWARWYKGATKVPTGGFRNPLAGLWAEGASLDRANRGVKEAKRTIRMVRNGLRGRIQKAELAARTFRKAHPDVDLTQGTPPPTAEAARAVDMYRYLTDDIQRLKDVRAKFPASLEALPWASLIHGTGVRPDPDFPEEEATELAIAALIPSYRAVVHAEYLRYDTQQNKAKATGYSLATYKRRLTEARLELRYRLTG